MVQARKRTSSWVGWVYFAATILFISGGINAIAGLTGIFNPDFYVAAHNGKLLLFNYATWGWAQLIIGAGMIALGAFLLKGKLWAQSVTIGLVVISMIVNLAFIGTYPLWSIVALILNSCVIYAITLHGDEVRNR